MPPEHLKLHYMYYATLYCVKVSSHDGCHLVPVLYGGLKELALSVTSDAKCSFKVAPSYLTVSNDYHP